MNRITGQVREVFKILAGYPLQARLLAGDMAKLQQARPQGVTDSAGEFKVATFHQRRGQSMDGATRQAEFASEILQRGVALGDHIDDV